MRERAAGRGWVARFYSRRGARLLPLWLVTGLCLVLLRSYRDLFDFWSTLQYFTFTQLFALRPPLLDPGWTIYCEVVYYALLPIVVAAVARVSGRPIKALTVLGFAVAGIALRPVLSSLGLVSPRLHAPLFAADLFVIFLAGVALRMAEQRLVVLRGKGTLMLGLAGAAGIVAVSTYPPRLGGSVLFNLVSIPPLVAIVASGTARSRVLAYVGRSAYGVYLLHMFFVEWVIFRFAITTESSRTRVLLIAVTIVAATLLAAFMLHRTVERPAIEWMRRRLTSRLARRQLGSAPGSASSVA